MSVDKICLKGLYFEACHGVYKEEKHVKQPFYVNIEMFVDTREAAQADDLALSVDYSLIYRKVCVLMERHSFNLLETLAARIAESILEYSKVQRVRVEVEKSSATCEERHFTSSVVIERGRPHGGIDLFEPRQ
ncbi:MAG: dihydroneopterin aldolase [Clostridiales bacterium]|nr:dihydroneopterin aldolase [Clostridiales bacterium]